MLVMWTVTEWHTMKDCIPAYPECFAHIQTRHNMIQQFFGLFAFAVWRRHSNTREAPMMMDHFRCFIQFIDCRLCSLFEQAKRQSLSLQWVSVAKAHHNKHCQTNTKNYIPLARTSLLLNPNHWDIDWGRWHHRRDQGRPSNKIKCLMIHFIWWWRSRLYLASVWQTIMQFIPMIYE